MIKCGAFIGFPQNKLEGLECGRLFTVVFYEEAYLERAATFDLALFLTRVT